MNDSTRSTIRNRGIVLALAVPTLLILGGCASSGDNSISGWDQVTVAPGDTANCESNPCHVFLKIPPGTGSYEVTGNQVRVGSYPAGRTADLGEMFSSQAFAIVGMDVPKAYVYIPVQP